MPRPIHLPVEIWQPIASGKTLPYIAQRGIKGMVTLNGERSPRGGCTPTRTHAAKAGRKLQLGEDLCLGLGLLHGRHAGGGDPRMEPYHDERYKWFAPFGFVRYADEQGRTWGTPGAPGRLPTLRDGVSSRHGCAGPRRRSSSSSRSSRRHIPASTR